VRACADWLFDLPKQPTHWLPRRIRQGQKLITAGQINPVKLYTVNVPDQASSTKSFLLPCTGPSSKKKEDRKKFGELRLLAVKAIQPKHFTPSASINQRPISLLQGHSRAKQKEQRGVLLAYHAQGKKERWKEKKIKL
jgi:hypothetical protein